MIAGGCRVSGVSVAWRTREPGRARRDTADELIADLADAGRADAGSLDVGRRCERCGAEDHGRPVVRGRAVHASVSYAADLVVVAVADAPCVLAVGIDAEHRGSVRTRDLRGIVVPGRRASLRRWTRIEAVLKADGRGIVVEPRRVRIERSLRGVHGRIAEETAATAHRAVGIRPRLRRVPGPRGFVISLAVASV